MTEFSPTTAFRLVRRLAAIGQDKASLYLLISDTAAIQAVRADIAAEVEVQLGVRLQAFAAEEVRPDKLEDVFTRDGGSPVTLIALDRWIAELVRALDRNIVLLTGTGAVLLLANHKAAEQTLRAAPNLRSRLTDILTISPDEAFRGVPA